MGTELQLAEPLLLSACAVLDCFDREVLLALGHDDEAALAALLASDDVLPVPDFLDAFQLREDVRSAALTWLRAERPGDELAVHDRAFGYFVQRIGEPQALAGRRALDERCCFYHLGALRLLLSEHREWERIRQYVARARAAQPQQPRHLQQLSLYEGFVAIRTQEYAAGEAILATLLGDPSSTDEIRMFGLNFMAQSHWFQTHYDRALALYQEVLTLANALGHRAYQGHALHNISTVYHEIGNYTRALALSQQSLQQFRALNDTYHEAHLLYEVAKNAMQLGHWQDARRSFQDSLQLYERLGVQAQLANVSTLQGMLHHALGDEHQSETHYRRSLDISQSQEYGDRPVAMDTWLLLGLLYQTQQLWDQALDAYAQAALLAHQIHNLHSLALSCFRRGDVYRATARSAEALDAYRESIDLVETLRGTTEIEEVKLGLLGATQQIYEANVLLLLDQSRYADAYHVVERARTRAFLDMLARKSPELYASFDQPVATLAEVQAQLPEGALLLEYYTTGVLPTGEHLLHHLKKTNAKLFHQLQLPPRIVIFALTRDRLVVRDVKLDPNLFRPQPDEIRPAQRWLHERKLRALYDHLIGPVGDLLPGRQQLFIIPHGPLHHVPFLALRAPDGRYLLDQGGPTVALAPSATVLVRNCLARPEATSGAFLALGYDDQSVSLQHAESEARSTARIMGGEAWTGPLSKREALAAAAAELRGLHIAGHAVYRPHDPLDSYLSLGIDDRLSARMIMQELNLRPGLVSLSGCTSGLNQVVPGDELLGLLRAWLYAGATTVVCALWEAADIVARLMIEHFYVALRAGASPGVAFRDAVVAVRQATGRSLAETFARWRREDVDAARPGALPEIPPDQLDACPYADAVVWGSFMLIGRA